MLNARKLTGPNGRTHGDGLAGIMAGVAGWLGWMAGVYSGGKVGVGGTGWAGASADMCRKPNTGNLKTVGRATAWTEQNIMMRKRKSSRVPIFKCTSVPYHCTQVLGIHFSKMAVVTVPQRSR